jgi:hypothetical protein
MEARIPGKNISKTNLDKFIEIFLATRIIFDLRTLLGQGKYYLITPIYGQLRALLTDVSDKNKKGIPTFFEIASLIGEKTDIHYMPNLMEKEFPHWNDNQIFHMWSLPISIERELPKQEIISLEDYLKLEVIKHEAKNLKASEVIINLSDKFGGSHYDSKIPEYLSKIISFRANDQHILNIWLVQFTDLFMKLSVKVLKRLTDFDVYIAAYFPSLPAEENYVFDFIQPSTNFKFSLYAFEGRLKVLLRDVAGYYVNLPLEKDIATKTIVTIRINHSLSNDLKSVLRVDIDNNNVLSDVNDSLIVINDFDNFQIYMNSSADKRKQNFEFGVIGFRYFREVLDEAKRKNLSDDFGKKNEISWFSKASFLYYPNDSPNPLKEGTVDQLNYPFEDL